MTDATTLRPDYAEAHANLGNVLKDQGKIDEAILAYQHAIAIKSDSADTHYNLANALADQGRTDDSITAYRQTVALRPDHVDAHYNLGNLLRAQGQSTEAIAAFEAAVRHRPRFPEAWSNLGNVLSEQGQFDKAVTVYRQALAVSPGNGQIYYNLGNALRERGQLEDAALAYREAIAFSPLRADAHGNLGIVLMSQGKIPEALAAYRQALAVDSSHAEAQSNLLFCLNYSDSEPAERVAAAHRAWAQARQQIAQAAHGNDRSVGRRLKVGYVSADFREHSVAYFFEPLLEAHDRQAVETYCYAEVLQPDAVTARLQELAAHWRSSVGLSDSALAEQIAADGIDILVDLAGHTAHTRLDVFARKPAPVQVTWLGYPNTSGLAAIDYRLVDAITDPPGEADAWASERLVRLNKGFLCFGGSPTAPDVAPLPCLGSGVVTFGSFNNPAKISGPTLDAWAQLLGRVPQARLLLKGRPLADAATRALFLARLKERGVASERVELDGWLSKRMDHLAHYCRVDIALDTFPYNGTTTTCEALWMGVPVLTLLGDRHASRVGASLLTQLGLQDWIATTLDDYVDIACRFAADPARLRDLRQSLRPRMTQSSLCDADDFARRVEASYRTMWQRWCEMPRR